LKVRESVVAGKQSASLRGEAGSSPTADGADAATGDPSSTASTAADSSSKGCSAPAKAKTPGGSGGSMQ